MLSTGKARRVYSIIKHRLRKPIVSMWEPWNKDVAEVVYYCKDYEDFVKSIEKTLAEDSEELRQKRLQIAKNNSRDRWFLEMNPIIEDMLYKKYKNCDPHKAWLT